MGDVDQPAESNSRKLLFRRHFATAVIVSILMSGHAREILDCAVIAWPFQMLLSEFGLWVFPANIIISLVAFAAIPIIQSMKSARPEAIDGLRRLQIWVWWSYWLLLALVTRFGRYVGP